MEEKIMIWIVICILIAYFIIAYICYFLLRWKNIGLEVSSFLAFLWPFVIVFGIPIMILMAPLNYIEKFFERKKYEQNRKNQN